MSGMVATYGMLIEVRYVPGVGWAYRVMTSKSEDWSGVAPSMDEAWANARSRAVRLDDSGITLGTEASSG